MLKKIIFALVLVCTIVSLSESQITRKRRDGLWWNALDDMHKTNYLIGYTKGMKIGAQAVLDSYIKGSRCYLNGKIDIEDISYKINFISADYMIYKIDSVYSDSTNLCLMLFHVYFLTLQEALGAHEADLYATYELFRRQDCDKFKTFKELEEYKLSY